MYGRPGGVKLDDPARDARVNSIITTGLESKSLSTLTYGLTAAIRASRRKPDVVLVMNVANGFWLPFFKVRGVPSLVNVDGMEWDRAKWGRLAKMMFRGGAKATAWWGSTLVYDSIEIAKRWKQQFHRDGVFIPYGGDVPRDLPIEPGLRHREYVLVVARFVPENTIPEFFDAIESIASERDVVIVGSSGYGGELDQRAAELSGRLDRVHWLGHVSDDDRLFSLWQHAGVYFHGHSVGGTNPALVQAMACGTPIVARDTIYNREVLGEGAILVEPRPDAIATTILATIGDSSLLNRLSQDAFSRSRTTYSWESVCESYASALSALVKGLHS